MVLCICNVLLCVCVSKEDQPWEIRAQWPTVASCFGGHDKRVASELT